MGGRFDDVRNARSLVFGAALRVHVARAVSEVAEVLRMVDRESKAGHWCYGYVGYEAAPGFDPNLTVARLQPASPNALPLVWFAVCDEVSEGPVISAHPPGSYQATKWHRRWNSDAYFSRVERIRSEISRGRTYQCNLTAQLEARISGDLLAFYADLVLRQGGCHSAYLDIGTHVIASASPELFFEWSAGEVMMRPMKGTAVRGRTRAEDLGQRQALSASAKERAENVMIVDLLRNDLSRVPGAQNVHVPRLCTPEQFDTVWQLTSDVSATVAPGASLLDMFVALFPSGSVTGAPKVQTMQLIAELEMDPRGVYCGAIGYVAPDTHRTRARFNVAIRTAVVERNSALATYGTGGAITWDSTPDREQDEMLAKARILAEPYREFQLLETMAYLPGRGVGNQNAHLARMGESAAYFGFAFDAVGVAEQLEREVAASGPARVRLLLCRTGQVHIELSPLPEPADGSLALVIDAEPIDSNQRWFFHKTTHREAYVKRAKRHPEADDVVLVNRHGLVTETTVGNLAVCLQGRWLTPKVQAGCLPGIERAKLVAAGALTEYELTADDVTAATQLAVVSSLRGWRPAHLLDAGERWARTRSTLR